MYWEPTRVLRVLLLWTSLTTLMFWLPLLRGAFDGGSYHWALGSGIAGVGVQGSYWVPALGSLLAMMMLFLGWRGARFPFHGLLLVWHLLLAAGSVYFAFTESDSFEFRGDTLGISFSLAWVAPLLCVSFALLAAYWVRRDLNDKESRDLRPWSRSNTRWLAALVCLLPLEFVLLRFGAPGGLTDQFGVIMIIGQWMLFGDALSAKPKGS